MVRRQRALAQVTTTLNGAITSGATSLTVNSASGFPTEGDFYINIGGEIILVTDVSGTTFSPIVRGQAGTAGASHDDGSNVKGVITAEEFYNRMKDRGEIKALPYGVIQDKDGTILTASNWTLLNGTGSTIENGQDGIIQYVSRLHTANDTSGMVRSSLFASGTDKRIVAHFACPAHNGSGNDYFSCYQRQNTGGSMSGISLYPNNKLVFQTRTTFLTVPTDVVTHGALGRRDLWVKVEIRWDVVATTDEIKWYYSWDGVHWWLIHTESLALTTCSPGIWMTNRTLANAHVHLLSWSEEDL